MRSALMSDFEINNGVQLPWHGTRDGVLVKYHGSDESVVVPEGVKFVATGAFSGNEHVVSVRLPEGVEEIEEAFSDCPNLERVFLPSGVERIHYRAFDNCPKLRAIDVAPGGKKGFKSFDGVLCGKNGCGWVFPAAKYAEGILRIPEGVQSYEGYGIGINGIYSPKCVRKIVFPKSMTAVHFLRFGYWENVEELEVVEGHANLRVVDGVLFDSKDALLFYPPQREGRRYVIPDGTQSIANGAFRLCDERQIGERLNELVLPSTLNKIESCSFGKCSELTIHMDGCPILVEDSAFKWFEGTIEFTGDASALSPKAFGETCKCTLALPNTSIDQLPSALKSQAALGFMQLAKRGRMPDGVEASYAKYIRSQKKRIYPRMLHNEYVADYMISEAVIPKKDLPELLDLARDGDDSKLVARLEEYAVSPMKPIEWRSDTPILQADEREDAPKPEVEPLVADLLTRHEISPKLKARIRKGAQLADGSGVSSPEALQLLVEFTSYPRKKASTVRYSSTNYEHLYALDWKTINKLAELFDKRALSNSLVQLFYDHKVQEALVAVCAFGDDEAVKRLVESMKSWDHWDGNGGSRRDLAIARGALLYNDSIEAMRHFESRKMLDVYARARGMSADELRDRTLSDFGFSKEGRKVFDLGTKIITATIGDDLKMVLFDDSEGKVVKSIPKRGTDPEKAEAAAAELAEMRKQIRTIVKQRKDLLFEDFLSGRERRIGAWKDAYLGNPVLRSVARLIVWQKGDVTFTVSDGRLVDATGTSVKLPAGDVKVAHPIEMTKADVDAWREYFATRALKQPFAQVWEKVVPKVSIKKDRYKGYPIPVYRFKGQEKHGIHLDLGEYNDVAVQISFDYDTAECKIKQLDFDWHSLENRVEIVSFTPYRHSNPRKLNHLVAYLDRVCFYPRLASNDLTVMDDLKDPTLEQIIDYARIASESGATELAAALLEYREEHFPEYGSVESLLLD